MYNPGVRRILNEHGRLMFQQPVKDLSVPRERHRSKQPNPLKHVSLNHNVASMTKVVLA